jgi:hypothetical protein
MVMIKYCKNCKEEIHPKRVNILPNTTTCVSCSNTGRKRGVTVLNGNIEKDDTWVDIVFMEPEQYEQYMKAENKLKNIINPPSKSKNQEYNNDIDFEEIL